MSTCTVTAGQRYYYNPRNSSVYPWHPQLEQVAGLLPFVAPSTGDFDVGMTLAQAQEDAETLVVESEKAKAKAEKKADKAEKAKKDAPKKDGHKSHSSHKAAAPTLGVTDDTD